MISLEKEIRLKMLEIRKEKAKREMKGREKEIFLTALQKRIDDLQKKIRIF